MFCNYCKISHKTVLAVLVFLNPFAHPSALANTYYIDPKTGLDTYPGSEIQPWRSLEKANKTLKAGDTVILLPGIYTGTINPLNSGSSNETQIRYRAKIPHQAIIDHSQLLRHWSIVSGTPGIDAVYKTAPEGNVRLVIQDSFEEAGPNAIFRDLNSEKKRLGLSLNPQRIQPGEFLLKDNTLFIRTLDSDSPDSHSIHSGSGLGVSLTNKRHILIDGIKISHVHRFIESSNSSYISINNVILEYAKGYDGVWLKDASNNWSINKCTIRGVGSRIQHVGNLVTITNSSNNLIDHCQFSFAGHAGLAIRGNSTFNVVSNSSFNNINGKLLELYESANHNLIQKNFFTGSPSANMMSEIHPADHPAVRIEGNNNIIRNNMIWRNLGGAIRITSSKDFQTTGNQITGNYILFNQGAWHSPGITIISYGNHSPENNYIINNLIYGNDSSPQENTQFLTYANSPTSKNFFSYNLVGSRYGKKMKLVSHKNSGQPSTALNYGANSTRHDNEIILLDTSWQFEKPNISNLSTSITEHLTCTPLSHTLSAGKGNSVPVSNSLVIFPGNPTHAGDIITIGGEYVVQVMGRDTSNHILYIDKPVSWTAGAGITPGDTRESCSGHK